MREGARRGGCAISMNVLFSGEQTTGLRYCDLIKMFLFQTTLGTHQELGNQTCYSIPSGQLLTSGERGYSLDNGQIVNHSTAKQQKKQKKLENLCYTYRIWCTALQFIVQCAEGLKLPSLYNQLYNLLSFLIFFSIYRNADPMKHGNQFMKENYCLMLRKSNKFLLT